MQTEAHFLILYFQLPVRLVLPCCVFPETNSVSLTLLCLPCYVFIFRHVIKDGKRKVILEFQMHSKLLIQEVKYN